MGRNRPSKATKKFESRHLARTIEKRKIQKRNKDKYNKGKASNEPRKAAANAIVEESTAKKAAENGKGSLFDGMTVDEFLVTGGEDVMSEEPSTSVADELEKSHVAGLERLKDKDPSFYEFLKENDRELLEFDPDELVEDEDGAEEAPIEGGLTLDILTRWEKLLIEQHSLGTLKKVLIAVKDAAANITGEESQTGNAQYVLSDPEGYLFLLV
jgi:nucleolar complex protein 2